MRATTRGGRESCLLSRRRGEGDGPARARLGVAAAVLVVLVAGASALATPDVIKKDATTCERLENGVCTTSYADSMSTLGLCRNDRDGSASAVSAECSCRTEGANHRSFIAG